MTRKNRKLYERINRAVEGKRQRVEVLQVGALQFLLDNFCIPVFMCGVCA